jgi:alanyl-tRNA synthetase
MILSADLDNDRFMLLAFAPKGVEVDCKEWVLSSLIGLDAKGGGKNDSAQYTVDGISSIPSVMDKAKSF